MDDGEADGSEGGALVGDEVRGPVGVVLVGEGGGAGEPVGSNSVGRRRLGRK